MLRQLLLCCMVVAWFAAPAFAQAPADVSDPVDPVQAAAAAAMTAQVNAASPGWTAGHTSVSDLPWQEKLVRCGTIMDGQASPRAHHAAAPAVLPAGALPAAIDWRDMAGRNYVTPVRDQQACGSCWAFSTLAAFESRLVRDWGLLPDLLDLSEQALVSCSLAGDCLYGGQLSDAAEQLVLSGAPEEDCFPYQGWNSPCAVGCAEQTDWTLAYTARSLISPEQTVEALKSAVAMYGPVAVGFVTYEDFYSYTGGVYRHVAGESTGGHGVCVVGYDDAEQCFIVKNSWGTGWGEEGYFRIAYDQMDNEVDFGNDATCFSSSAYPEAQLLPLVSINGSLQEAMVPTTEPVTLDVGLTAIAAPQGDLEWWLVRFEIEEDEEGDIVTIPVATYVLGDGWVDGMEPMHVGDVGGGFPGVTVLKDTLPEGRHVFAFGLDPHADGDFQPAWLSYQMVTVYSDSDDGNGGGED